MILLTDAIIKEQKKYVPSVWKFDHMLMPPIVKNRRANSDVYTSTLLSRLKVQKFKRGST